MPTEEKILSKLERRCLMKFFLKDYKIFKNNCNEETKKLGLEAAFETVLEIAQKEPDFIKVLAHDENNFVVLVDIDEDGKPSPVFTMRDGAEVVETNCEEED